jgi:hypothetical protein
MTLLTHWVSEDERVYGTFIHYVDKEFAVWRCTLGELQLSVHIHAVEGEAMETTIKRFQKNIVNATAHTREA